MSKFKEFITVLLNPNVWYQQIPYDSEQDKLVRQLLKRPIQEIDSYHLIIDGVSLWIGNMPYSCFNIHKTFEKNYLFRPSRYTILQGMKKIKGMYLTEHKAEMKKLHNEINKLTNN